jgi:hypothetical protein
MNSLYLKIAVISVCTALGFALGTNKEAKAATFSLTNTNGYYLADRDRDGLPDFGFGGGNLPVGIGKLRDTDESYRGEYRAFYEFYILSLFTDSNRVISSAILQTRVDSIEWSAPYFPLQAYGYTQNDKVDFLKLYNAGEYLDQKYFEFSVNEEPQGIATFNVLPFINQSIKDNNNFAGFIIRFLNDVPYTDNEGFIYLDSFAHLTITTVDAPEPVPEPTTIFGSALALGVGGWLKRKKSSQQNKTTSQH